MPRQDKRIAARQAEIGRKKKRERSNLPAIESTPAPAPAPSAPSDDQAAPTASVEAPALSVHMPAPQPASSTAARRVASQLPNAKLPTYLSANAPYFRRDLIKTGVISLIILGILAILAIVLR